MDLNRCERSTKYSVRFSHGSLYEESSNVLPSLFHEGDQEVDGHS